MNLLILGGTIFLGKHLTAAALERGHTVTLFNRGRHTNPFPEVETIQGDRDGGLDALAGRQWDTVIDTSGYVPRIVRASAEALANAVDQYVFISTISVYADMSARWRGRNCSGGTHGRPDDRAGDGRKLWTVEGVV